MRFTEGRAWIVKCDFPPCEHPIIEAHVYGLKLRLSTKAIPYKDALVVQKYERIVVNIWKGALQLYATAWFKEEGPVKRGHLYVQHIHRARP
jgi:hypothetical protein